MKFGRCMYDLQNVDATYVLAHVVVVVVLVVVNLVACFATCPHKTGNYISIFFNIPKFILDRNMRIGFNIPKFILDRNMRISFNIPKFILDRNMRIGFNIPKYFYSGRLKPIVIFSSSLFRYVLKHSDINSHFVQTSCKTYQL